MLLAEPKEVVPAVPVLKVLPTKVKGVQVSPYPVHQKAYWQWKKQKMH
jgi:hypothetical protein